MTDELRADRENTSVLVERFNLLLSYLNQIAILVLLGFESDVVPNDLLLVMCSGTKQPECLEQLLCEVHETDLVLGSRTRFEGIEVKWLLALRRCAPHLF